MEQLFDLAFTRIERAKRGRAEFGEAWAEYISRHPWEINLDALNPCQFEIHVVVTEPAPLVLSMVFSEWLAALRAALDNGLYAWAAAVTGQNPPPKAESLQYPICETAADFKKQSNRLKALPVAILGKLEGAQPYQSPYGPKSNLFYWLNELARTDRHRTPHVGLGRIAEHKVRIGIPNDATAVFDTTVWPYNFIDNDVVVGRFTTSRPFASSQITCDLTGVGIDPEIRGWADFDMNGAKPSLERRMIMTELFTRNNLENMALFSGVTPLGGFQTFDPANAEGT